jgi:uncharacterized UBP type Zn finger protein
MTTKEIAELISAAKRDCDRCRKHGHLWVPVHEALVECARMLVVRGHTSECEIDHFEDADAPCTCGLREIADALEGR